MKPKDMFVRNIKAAINRLSTWRAPAMQSVQCNDGTDSNKDKGAIVPVSNSHLLSTTLEYLPNNCSTDIPLEIIGEEIIGGKFKVVSYLESGGIADIFIVQDETGKKYAAKILKQSGNPENLKRILRESEVMVLLSGKPHILEFIALGHIDIRPIIILEFADGGSLHEQMQGGDLQFKQKIAYLRDVLEGLISMHESGLIHRDIKPKNILIVDDVAKLSDFDLTISTGDDLYTSIQGGISGTVNYMSPEQIREEELDFKSDIYAFGATSYHVLTGVVPFKGKDVGEIMDKHLHEVPASPRSLNELIPKELEDVIVRSMSKDPNDRPQALEFQSKLQTSL